MRPFCIPRWGWGGALREEWGRAECAPTQRAYEQVGAVERAAPTITGVGSLAALGGGRPLPGSPPSPARFRAYRSQVYAAAALVAVAPSRLVSMGGGVDGFV